jgi:hypothetical protein
MRSHRFSLNFRDIYREIGKLRYLGVLQFCKRRELASANIAAHFTSSRSKRNGRAFDQIVAEDETKRVSVSKMHRKVHGDDQEGRAIRVRAKSRDLSRNSPTESTNRSLRDPRKYRCEVSSAQISM